jgi:hypothetical protein
MFCGITFLQGNEWMESQGFVARCPTNATQFLREDFLFQVMLPLPVARFRQIISVTENFVQEQVVVMDYSSRLEQIASVLHPTKKRH